MHWKTSSKSCFGETRWQLSLAEEDATGWKYFGHTCNHPHKLLIDQSDCSNSFSYGIVSYSVHISTGSLPTSTYCTWQEAALERGSSNVQFIKHLWNNIATSVNHVMLTYGHTLTVQPSLVTMYCTALVMIVPIVHTCRKSTHAQTPFCLQWAVWVPSKGSDYRLDKVNPFPEVNHSSSLSYKVKVHNNSFPWRYWNYAQ